eukprot:GHVP01049774.1.p1 GENE.GHVP01049774.1~~GHVP01049774.1.p1  ORF type:complete len:105 (-),score=4.36 GHVP01049774.1:591-905(-)
MDFIKAFHAVPLALDDQTYMVSLDHSMAMTQLATQKSTLINYDTIMKDSRTVSVKKTYWISKTHLALPDLPLPDLPRCRPHVARRTSSRDKCRLEKSFEISFAY